MQSRYYLYYKLLAEQGTSDSSLPDVLQVLEAALEELAVCKDTQASCSTLLIRLCYLDTQRMYIYCLGYIKLGCLFNTLQSRVWSHHCNSSDMLAWKHR